MSDAPVAPAFESLDTGPGPDSCPLAAPAGEHNVAAPFFQRGHRCRTCRTQGKRVKARSDAFRARNAVAVSVLFGPVEHAREFADDDLPCQLLADPGATAAGRTPRVAVRDPRPAAPRIVRSNSGPSTVDRPSSRAAVDDYRR